VCTAVTPLKNLGQPVPMGRRREIQIAVAHDHQDGTACRRKCVRRIVTQKRS
jgi:hypothetical protein